MKTQESLGESRVPAILRKIPKTILGRRKLVFGEILSFLGTDLGKCLKGLKYGYERNIEQ